MQVLRRQPDDLVPMRRLVACDQTSEKLSEMCRLRGQCDLSKHRSLELTEMIPPDHKFSTFDRLPRGQLPGLLNQVSAERRSGGASSSGSMYTLWYIRHIAKLEASSLLCTTANGNSDFVLNSASDRHMIREDVQVRRPAFLRA